MKRVLLGLAILSLPVSIRAVEVEIGGEQVSIPEEIDPSHSNSRFGTEPPERIWKRDDPYYGRRELKGAVKERVIREWGEVLHQVKVGEWGRVKQMRIVQILGDDDMLVDKVALGCGILYASSDETLRLKGFSTQGLVDGRYWLGPDGTGIQVAITGTWRYVGTDGAARTVFMAIPLSVVPPRGRTRTVVRKEIAEVEAQIADLNRRLVNLRKDLDFLPAPKVEP